LVNLDANKELGIGSGMIIAVPISEKDSFGDPLNLEKCIQDALKECGKLAIKGKQVTPFVLQKVKELTKGGSLKASTII
jgi:pseudouridine-5'-phosphate glycosidase